MNFMQNLNQFIKDSVIEPFLSTKRFSLEFTLIGRNDDYEPNWREHLESTITYNRALFTGSNIDFRVALVEWNPPAKKPKLAETLVAKFPFLRAIVVAPEIHRELCRSREFKIMLNFSLNAAMRTSQADFILISGADIFLGRDTVNYLKNYGLKRKCLYRAERVSIRRKADFSRARPEQIENPPEIVGIDVCDLPPYNQPPYTNACGDFLLLDTDSCKILRGFDENITDARLHLDSRFALSAAASGFDSKLIGHIFHIDHKHSLVNMGDKYPGKKYDFTKNIPYANSEEWGLRGRKWEKISQQLDFVS